MTGRLRIFARANSGCGREIRLAQIWTIIFVAVLAVAFALAHWYDCDEATGRERRNVTHEKEEVRQK